MSPMTEAFEAVRGRLFAVAYRLLGSATEAEDVLQNAYERWAASPARRSPATPAGPSRYCTPRW